MLPQTYTERNESLLCKQIFGYQLPKPWSLAVRVCGAVLRAPQADPAHCPLRLVQEKSNFMVKDVPKGQKLSEGDYLYWKQKALEYSNNLDSANEDTTQTQAEKLKTSENVQSLPSPTWNCSSVSSTGVSIDRRSWIEDADGANIIYMLESEGVPRYQKSRISLTQARGLEIALMRIFRTDQYVLPGDFVPGEQKYEGVMRTCFKIPENVPVTNEEEVKTFFGGCVAERSGATDPNQMVECSVARRGYMDDPMNTDNCWREVELWKVHYNCEETLGEKFHSNVIWRLVTDDLFLKLPSSHSNLFNEVWNFQGMLPA